ncbi:MAG: hypothetical protein KatS3mg034_1969 [Vicingaceae bacterium]|nr:MAG: hypothetical protein KatS3mg034_1969 [Vicingaceae bacterium]
MKKSLFVFFVLIFLLNKTIQSQQKIYWQHFQIEIPAKKIDKPDVNEKPFNDIYYRLISFKQIPSLQERQSLLDKGIKLLDYIPQKTYYASIKDFSVIEQFPNIEAVLKIPFQSKLSLSVQNNDWPAWAIRGKDSVAVRIHLIDALSKIFEFPGSVSYFSANGRYFDAVINKNDLAKLAEIPVVQFIDHIPEEPQKEDWEGKNNHRSNNLDNEYNPNPQYTGENVAVIMNDDGIIGPHIDYQGRIIVQYPTNNSGNHGDHVAGIILGAGNYNPDARGMAPGAKILVYNASGYPGFDSIYNQYNWANPWVRITSTSYSDGCNAGYTSLTQKLDQQIRQMPELMHVFSAGNNGTSNCGYGAGSGWGNITGGHKQGKNVIAVANVSNTDNLASSSSRGPAHDGRIKPDISAVGTSVFSTIDPNTYATFTGTSMSCPAISGILAQLYDYYFKTHNQMPPSALIKATILNTADDLGNPGPDFKFGWGRVNARRALNLLQQNQYLSDTVVQSQIKTHVLTIPAGVKKAKIMVYWHDYEATVNTSWALVNNINMTITDPSSNTLLPLVLDPTPNATNLNLPATPGIDSLNNMEQIVIDNPQPGNYTVNISGYNIPQGPQKYFVVYDFIYDDITVTYPNGFEGLQPGSTHYIRWDAWNTSLPFTIEYSTDSGATWNLIASNVSGTARYFQWYVPTVVTGKALIRVSNGMVSDISDHTFTIIGVPSNLSVDWKCPDSLKLSWNPVFGSGGYEVRMLGNMYMDSIAFTTQNFIVIPINDPNQDHWFTVIALTPGDLKKGKRAYAIYSPSGVFNCSFPHDLAIVQLQGLTPNYSTECNPKTYKPGIGIKNTGQNNINNLTIEVYKNGSLETSASYNQLLVPGQTVFFNINNLQTNTSAGTYNYVFVVKNSNDVNPFNDTAKATTQVYITPTINTPQDYDLETEFNCATTSDCEATICNLSNGWVNVYNSISDDIDWRVNNGSTPSVNTGPTTDYNPGTVNGKYLYTEASNDCYNKTAVLLSPCIDLSQFSNPVFEFAYHMYGSAMGTLRVDILHNDLWYPNVIPPININQNQWKVASIPLQAFAGGKITIAIKGTTGNNYTSDMAIDDFKIYDNVSVKEYTSSNTYIYPNPAFDQINIISPNAMIEQIRIFDQAGKEVYQNFERASKIIVNSSNFAAGIYFIRIQTNLGIENYKLIKQD